MAKIRDYFYFDGVKKLYLETPHSHYDICPRCNGDGLLECSEEDDDCDSDELVWDCDKCGGMGEIERHWLSKQEFMDEYVNFEPELTDEIKWIVEMIEIIDRQHKLLKRRYGKEIVPHIADYWVKAMDNALQKDAQ